MTTGAALAGAGDVQAFAQVLLARALEFAQAARAYLVLEHEGMWSVVAGATQSPSIVESYESLPLTTAHENGLLRVASILQTIRSRRTHFDHGDERAQQPIEVLCIPLLFNEQVIAVLYLERKERTFAPLAVQLLARLVQQAAPRLQNLLEMGRLAELIRLRREMTEALRASEDRFRSIFNSSPVMIFLTDSQGRLMMVNDYWLQSLGYSRVEAVSRNIAEFCTPTSRQLLDRLVHLPSATDTQYENLPVQFVKRNGAHLDALVSGVILHSEVEGAYQCMSFGIDMTAHRRAEQELDRYRRRLEDLVRERTEELSAVNRRLEQDIVRRKEAEQALLEAAAVNERHRLARELHDSVTQTLYSMSLFVDATRLALTAGQVQRAGDNLVELRAMSRDAMESMRALIFELHPPELAEIGLVGALREYLKNYQHRTQMVVEFELHGEERSLPVRTESELYRVAQEALSNCIKHARADRVQVTLHYGEGRLELIIRDNGVGFDADVGHLSGGMGLRSMAERVRALGGVLDVESAAKRGTAVYVRLNDAPAQASGGSARGQNDSTGKTTNE